MFHINNKMKMKMNIDIGNNKRDENYTSLQN